MPLRFDAAILSRMRSPAISRSNWAKESSMLSVRRPMDVVELNCCVTDTKDALWASRTSTILAKSASDQPIDLVDNNDLNLAGLDIFQKCRKWHHRSAVSNRCGGPGAGYRNHPGKAR